MLNKLERHDLLFLTWEGRAEAWSNREPVSEETQACWNDYPAVPAIFTGRTDEQGLLQVGFSFPRRVGAMRCRMASRVPAQAVTRTVTPWAAAQLAGDQDTPAGTLICQLQAAAGRAGVSLGVFGATALQMVTKLPYLHDSSDLDIVLRTTSPSALEQFWAQAEEMERSSGIRVDAELQAGPNRYVKCKELFSTQRTVLVKGGATPQLLSRRAVWNMLSDG